MASVKTCTKCGADKPLSEFNRRSLSKDGLRYECKSCHTMVSTQYRERNLDYVRAKDCSRNKLPHRRALIKTAVANWGVTYPERLKSKNILQRAVASGVVKKQPCFVCGESTTEAHHPDYSAPLDVVWLCKRHHEQVHSEHYRMNKLSAEASYEHRP